MLRLRRDRLLPLSSVHGLLRHVYGLMELYGLRHGLRYLRGLFGGHPPLLFRIRMRVSRSSVRSILDQRGRLCILYRLRRLLLRYVLRHGCCRFRFESLRLSVLSAQWPCFLLRLWRLHKRLLSEKASLGGFFCTSAIFASMSFCLSGAASAFACLSHVSASE